MSNKIWWHVHRLAGGTVPVRHSHLHIDWWHGDHDHGEGEEPKPLRQETIPASSQTKPVSGHTEQFMHVSAPLWPDQPSRSKHKILEL